ncbi:GntR family transcriptional regulator [Azospirillum rugosum]|uniref:DNA-binding GntR family transcriptional regulator n=1 Tax=Azospirillum rugosum TaxID=416170 RepID=A0ABS4SVG3_9PROT|nr:GntR family transcriptional regulator [Azospirillum rugosum]MBP2296559.1 DNA-binding GntR family transcriptional regulator [Azospirillum rugosum]MDQ0530041.1 DNA-binding GntR family transcriptional regulator [Azospirillum rugosum]
MAAIADKMGVGKTSGAQRHEQIVQSIMDAIADRRLPPGTKLTEERLAQIFGVSRARIRSALSALAQVGLVELRPNRGAYVARPSADEAREVFEARRIVERGLLERLTRNGPLPPGALARLRAHLAQERAAEAANDRASTIRLSGDFHLLLADLAGNGTLAGFLDSLVRQSSLAIAALEARPATDCSAHEHEAIVDALATADGTAANRLMTEHLEAIENRLAPDARAPDVDLFAVFGSVPSPLRGA